MNINQDRDFLIYRFNDLKKYFYEKNLNNRKLLEQDFIDYYQSDELIKHDKEFTLDIAEYLHGPMKWPDAADPLKIKNKLDFNPQLEVTMNNEYKFKWFYEDNHKFVFFITKGIESTITFSCFALIGNLSGFLAQMQFFDTMLYDSKKITSRVTYKRGRRDVEPDENSKKLYSSLIKGGWVDDFF